MGAVRAALAVVHVGVAAVWLGGMLYSLLVVQPRLESFFRDDSEREDFATVLASGARWKVLGLAAALFLSGAGMAAIELDDSPGAGWAAVVVAKALLLGAAVALFAYVSWSLWPRRLLAHLSGSPELGAIQARFRLAAWTLTALIAAGLVLGVVADSLR